MNDMFKINVSLLKSYESKFNTELNSFNNKTYATFSSSYLNSCADGCVSKMASQLEKIYETIKKGYTNIDKWWIDYNDNASGLENYLSGKGSLGSISEASIRNSASQLPELKKYNLDFAGIIPAGIAGAEYGMAFANNTVVSSVGTFDTIDSEVPSLGSVISDTVESVFSGIAGWFSSIPWLENAANFYWNIIKSTGATLAVFVQSLIQGIGQFVEAIVDLVAIVGTAAASIVTGLWDGGQAIWGAITGEDWESLTKKMWNGTMGFVATQYVVGWMDLLYQNTGYGQWLVDNALGFDIVRGIGSGIGYVAGIVALTIATFGVGGVAVAGGSAAAGGATAAAAGSATAAGGITMSTQLAITATAAGIGKGVQNAWADGASLVKGLIAGILNGLWEGFQFYIGGKISGLNIFGGKGLLESVKLSGVGTQVLNSLGRIILDGIDGGAEGFVTPLIQTIYKDGYYDENGEYVEFSDVKSLSDVFERYGKIFEENGGFVNVLTQASVGAISSLIGELFDLRKYFGNKKSESKVNMTSDELEITLDKYNELMEIKNSDDYKKYMDLKNNKLFKGSMPEFDGVENELASISLELARYKYNQLVEIKNSDDYISYMDNVKNGYNQTPRPEFDNIEMEFKAVESDLAKMVRQQQFKIEKDNALNEFQKVIKKGKKSDKEAIDLMYELFDTSIVDENWDALNALQAFNKAKEKNPSIHLTSLDGRNCYSPYSYSININKGNKVKEFMAHELGHLFHFELLDEVTPDNFNMLLDNARASLSPDSVTNQFSSYYNEAKKEFNDLALNDYYTSKLDSDFSRFSSIENKSPYVNMTYDEFLKAYTEDFAKKHPEVSVSDLEYLTTNDIRMDIYAVNTEYMYDNGIQALSDICDAFLKGKLDVPGALGHGVAYYSLPDDREFKEMIANFTAMKIMGNKKTLQMTKEIIGTSLYDVLDGTFKQFK